MSHERPDPTQSTARPTDHATESGRPRAVNPETGSVWWAELALGVACTLTAAVVVLASTSVGPFGALAVTYGPTLTLAYLGVAGTIGLGFAVSGLRSSPYVGRTATGADAAVRSDGTA